MGGAAKTVQRGVLAGVTGGLSEFGQSNPFGAPVNNPLHPLANSISSGLFPNPNNPSQTTSGPFSIDPAQVAADQESINNLGQSQYNQTLQGIGDVSTANTARAKDLFGQMLPDIAENSNAAHLYDSTGYGQEVARQQANIASQVANQEAQLKLGALSPLQSMQQSALSRGFSLNDFINQANVAKAIGATAAPQVGNGKGQTGTLLSGVGATAPVITALKGAGKGAAAGGVPGAVAGAVLPTVAGSFNPVG